MITVYTVTEPTQTLDAGPGTMLSGAGACGGANCVTQVSCNPGDLAIGGEYTILDTIGAPRQDVPMFSSEAAAPATWSFDVLNGRTFAVDITLGVRCLDITP